MHHTLIQGFPWTLIYFILCKSVNIRSQGNLRSAPVSGYPCKHTCRSPGLKNLHTGEFFQELPDHATCPVFRLRKFRMHMKISFDPEDLFVFLRKKCHFVHTVVLPVCFLIMCSLVPLGSCQTVPLPQTIRVPVSRLSYTDLSPDGFRFASDLQVSCLTGGRTQPSYQTRISPV